MQSNYYIIIKTYPMGMYHSVPVYILPHMSKTRLVTENWWRSMNYV